MSVDGLLKETARNIKGIMQPLTFVTLSKKVETSQELREALVGSGRARLLSACETQDQLLGDLIRLRPAAAIIHITTETADKDLALIKQLGIKSPNTAVISTSDEAVPSLILGSMRAGAREFLQL